jgi:uncharacterized membrane protein/predicted DsbA family dithiol-disulfide isomerase
MRSRVARWALVVVLIGLGLAASGALFVDYTNASPVFCAEGGGCDALRQTALARPLGIPLPIAGIAGFLVLAMLALTRGPRVRVLNLLLSLGAGVVGLGLLVAQGVLHHLCPYCAAVDSSAVLLALLAIDRVRAEWDPPTGAVPALASALGLTLAIAAPTLWARHVAGRVPRVIAEELAQTPDGAVTIVDFVDFECPFCRQMQEKLGPKVLAQKDKIRLVRKMVPLTRIHPHALAAAKAACCGEVLGKGDAMADALFQTNVEDLTPEGCAHVAAELGLPLDQYRACLASPDTDARLAKDRHEFDQAAVKGDGLPLMWVGSHKLMGAQDDATLSRVLGEALTRAGS